MKQYFIHFTVPPLPPKKGDSAKRAQQTKSRDCSDLKLDPKQDIPTNSTSSISSQPDPIQARAPKPFSNSERPRSYHVQDSVAVPEPVETPQQQQLPLHQATQEEKSKMLVPEPVVIVQPSSGMTLLMASWEGTLNS